VNQDKSPIIQAVDLAFFGPLGLALAAKDALPGWVDDGRSRIVHQVDTARVVGEHVTRHGRKVVTRTLVGLGIVPGPPPPPRPRRSGEAGSGPGSPQASANGRGSDRAATRPTPPQPIRQARAVAGAAPGRAPEPARASTESSDARVSDSAPAADPAEAQAKAVPASAELAIPGYDSLSAFQVVQRLAGLAPLELEAVRAYEAAGRGRRTILTKISQLQNGWS